MKFDRIKMAMMNKRAAAVLTPEAEQAAVAPQGQPPMDPAAGGMPPQGAPMDPAMMQGAPSDPNAMGGAPMPPGGAPVDPNAATGVPVQASGPNGGQIPPEILQDQQFIAFLAQVLGITLDPNSGTFIDSQGNPIPADMIIQAYQLYQAQMQQRQAAPQGQPPMDPSMMGGAPMPPEGAPMDPNAMGGMPPPPAEDPNAAPMDPSMMGGMPPEGAPMDPAAQQEDIVNQIASAVMTATESIIEERTAGLEKKISALMDMMQQLKDSVLTMTDITDKRTQRQNEQDKALQEELAADLNPTVKTAAVHKANAPLDIMTLLRKKD